VVPGDDKPDAALFELSTVPHEDLLKLWRCLSEGGPDNALQFFEGLTGLVKGERVGAIAQPLPKAGVYRSLPAANSSSNSSNAFRAVLIFYRALMQAGDLAPVDTLVDALARRGFDVDALYVSSLREDAAADFVRRAFEQNPPDIILNATAFATGEGERARPFGTDAPWLHVVFSGQSRETWENFTAGLSPHFIAMHVALPELAGRMLTCPMRFRLDTVCDPLTEHDLVE